MWVQANGSDLYSVPAEIGYLFGEFHGDTAIDDAYEYLEFIKGKYPQYF